ncbi:hypothetical protein DFJ77DRAFT_467670 [Powellomyces hirtus]|nr:hypothetical protein DFJ77DRAFT_467670 [Powellomyces hirtus]
MDSLVALELLALSLGGDHLGVLALVEGLLESRLGLLPLLLHLVFRVHGGDLGRLGGVRGSLTSKVGGGRGFQGSSVELSVGSRFVVGGRHFGFVRVGLRSVCGVECASEERRKRSVLSALLYPFPLASRNPRHAVRPQCMTHEVIVMSLRDVTSCASNVNKLSNGGWLRIASDRIGHCTCATEQCH